MSACSCRQLVEQRLGLLQIERVEAFGKLVLDWREKIAGLIPLALVAPEPRHPRRRAQFPRLLPASHPAPASCKRVADQRSIIWKL